MCDAVSHFTLVLSIHTVTLPVWFKSIFYTCTIRYIPIYIVTLLVWYNFYIFTLVFYLYTLSHYLCDAISYFTLVTTNSFTFYMYKKVHYICIVFFFLFYFLFGTLPVYNYFACIWNFIVFLHSHTIHAWSSSWHPLPIHVVHLTPTRWSFQQNVAYVPTTEDRLTILYRCMVYILALVDQSLDPLNNRSGSQVVPSQY